MCMEFEAFKSILVNFCAEYYIEFLIEFQNSFSSKNNIKRISVVLKNFNIVSFFFFHFHHKSSLISFPLWKMESTKDSMDDLILCSDSACTLDCLSAGLVLISVVW